MPYFALEFEFLYSNPENDVSPIHLFEITNSKSKVHQLKFRPH
jgi:hypothetical protein